LLLQSFTDLFLFFPIPNANAKDMAAR